jgi:hypothetical protein
VAQILTRTQLEHRQRVSGDKGIFVKYRDIRCGACHATVFVPSWPDGSAQLGEYVPAAWEKMHEQGGCPECRPEMPWELSLPKSGL